MLSFRRSETMGTGAVFFHRFYMFHSFKQYPRYVRIRKKKFSRQKQILF